jgi:hypothetical protein
LHCGENFEKESPTMNKKFEIEKEKKRKKKKGKGKRLPNG